MQVTYTLPLSPKAFEVGEPTILAEKTSCIALFVSLASKSSSQVASSIIVHGLIRETHANHELSFRLRLPFRIAATE